MNQKPFTREQLAAKAELHWILDAFVFFLFAMTYQDATFAEGVKTYHRYLEQNNERP